MDNLNIKLTVEAWTDIVIKEWVNKAAALGISPYAPLNVNRFYHHVNTNANGDPDRVEFAFDYFLNFVDWGVGKGVTLENRDMLLSTGITKRRKKPFFTNVFYKQIKVLVNLLAEKNAGKAQAAIIFEFEKDNT